MSQQKARAESRPGVQVERPMTPLQELSAAVDRFWATFPDPRSEQARLFVRACSAGMHLARRGTRAHGLLVELDRLLREANGDGGAARAAYVAARASGLSVDGAVAAAKEAGRPGPARR